jgi:hypothetical protein
MPKFRWYKRDPDAALGGMMGLTLEERGAYNTVLDLIYIHTDKLLDDDRFIAGWCGCDVRIWRRIRGRLIHCGKLSVDNGYLRNERATDVVLRGIARGLSSRNAAIIKHRKSKVVMGIFNGLAPATAHATAYATALPYQESKKESESESVSKISTDAARGPALDGSRPRATLLEKKALEARRRLLHGE